MSDDGVLDGKTIDALLDSLGGDKEFFAELVEIFLTDAPDLFAAMHQGIQAADSEAVHRAAHTLKSTAASLGALNLSETARTMELLSRDGDLCIDVEAAEEQFDAAKDAFGTLIGGEEFTK